MKIIENGKQKHFKESWYLVFLLLPLGDTGKVLPWGLIIKLTDRVNK